MPRPKKDTSAEPKKRSRTGCWPCKARKVKCGEEKPSCANCVKSAETCDYSIRLNWGGRSKKGGQDGFIQFEATPPPTGNAREHHTFSAQHIATAPSRPSSGHSQHSVLPTPTSTPRSEPSFLDPAMQMMPGAPAPTSFPSPYASHPPLAPPQAYLPMLQTYPSFSPPPPSSATSTPDFSWSPQHRTKRVKLSQSPQMSQPPSVFARPEGSGPSPESANFTPRSINSVVNTPATPGSSIASPGGATSNGLTVQDPPDLRRLSVKSLLSDENESPRIRYPRMDSHGYRLYGYDHGLPDLDVPHNNDTGVIQPQSPDLRRTSNAASTASGTDSDAETVPKVFEKGGYYASPVPIKLPTALEPLPPELLGNQMNLLYFHHFINHTGRILVPHDCPENPFRSVLPQMAVRNSVLLHILLAFSASHRARLLDHPEPANRIAGWVSDVFPALRQALDQTVTSPSASDPTDPSSLAPLATSIMLASLEIISPNTFAVPISWQDHLQVARQLIVLKGGLHHLAQKADGARDKAVYFLSRWFAYLDVLGSLSGSKVDQPLYGAYLEDGGGMWLVNRHDEEVFQIDCFFGFSGRCIALLAQVAELAQECDTQRIDSTTNEVDLSWRPTERTRARAQQLRERLAASVKNVYRGCMHANAVDSPHQDVEEKSEKDIEEIYATNEAYHWAGMIHLSRRVLALPTTHPDVQHSVRLVLENLGKVRRGSTAESCLLFPMFTAGCECVTEADRAIVMDRLKALEGWGMMHVHRARQLMQEVWSTGRAWETLVSGEFFG